VPVLYSVYGFRVRSNLPLPGLEVLPYAERTDVSIWLGRGSTLASELVHVEREPFFVSPDLDGRGEPVLAVWKLARGAFFQFLYGDGTEFVVDGQGTRIWASWPEGLTLEDTVTYLLGPILGFVLVLRGITCLHASAVAIGNQAIALVGPQGVGKSTTAAAFARLGYPVLSDDVVPIREQGGDFLVSPGYPRLNLWPESVSALYGSPATLPPITPNWDKCYLALNENGHHFQRVSLPLTAIYFLGDRSDDLRAPFIEAVAIKEGLVALIANTYVNHLLDKEMRAREFQLMGGVVARVPVRQVCPHADPVLLPRLCEVVLEDFHSIVAAASSARTATPA